MANRSPAVDAELQKYRDLQDGEQLLLTAAAATASGLHMLCSRLFEL
jgi:hypothetical protein